MHLVLDVERRLEVILPVLAFIAIVRPHRVFVEDAQPIEVHQQAVEHDDIRRDDEEVRTHVRVCLVPLVVVRPRQQQAHDFGLARSRGKFHHVARPVLIEHPLGHAAGLVVLNETVGVASLLDFVQPDCGLYCLTLTEVVAELFGRSVSLRLQVLGLEPPVQERPGSRTGSGIVRIAPLLHALTDAVHQRREQRCIAGVGEYLIARIPAFCRVEDYVRVSWEVRADGH